VEQDGSCSAEQDCKKGLNCVNKKCVGTNQQGENKDCLAGFHCKRGYYCKQNGGATPEYGKCTKRIKNGASCKDVIAMAGAVGIAEDPCVQGNLCDPSDGAGVGSDKCVKAGSQKAGYKTSVKRLCDPSLFYNTKSSQCASIDDCKNQKDGTTSGPLAWLCDKTCISIQKCGGSYADQAGTHLDNRDVRATANYARAWIHCGANTKYSTKYTAWYTMSPWLIAFIIFFIFFFITTIIALVLWMKNRKGNYTNV
jgi:hypothetical protein